MKPARLSSQSWGGGQKVKPRTTGSRKLRQFECAVYGFQKIINGKYKIRPRSSGMNEPAILESELWLKRFGHLQGDSLLLAIGDVCYVRRNGGAIAKLDGRVGGFASA